MGSQEDNDDFEISSSNGHLSENESSDKK
jgi:hypothetical protein